VTELRRYLSHFRSSWPALAISAALMGVAAVIPGAAVLLLRETLDEVLLAGRVDRLAVVAASFAGLYLVAGAVKVLRTRITKGVAWRVTSGLRRELHRHYLRLSAHQQGAVGERVARLTHEVDELQYGVSALVTAFRNPLTLLVLAGTAWVLAPRLAPWALLLLPAVLLPSWWGGRRLRRLAARIRDARSALGALLVEQLAGLSTVQAFGAEAEEIRRFAHLDEEDRRARLRLEVERVLPSALVQAVAAAAVGLLLWIGGRAVLRGELDAGELVGFAVALGLMNRPLSGLSEVWSLLQRSLAALEKVYTTLDQVPDLHDPVEPRPLPAGPLELRWEGVSVDYGDGPVVHDVSLEAVEGELLAMVGPSGGGKSSLLDLVARFRDPAAGRVVIGGVDVRDVALAELRAAVAVVRQQDVLFSRTVAENIALGRPRASTQAIRTAARQAGAAQFVSRLPEGYDTPLDAQSLSAGERQRLCLARALLTDARVLLLDEATNQVDAETERAILAALDQARSTRTVVMVAHNLAAVRGADRIAVVDGGSVGEVGTHQALLGRRGRYAALLQAQQRGEVA